MTAFEHVYVHAHIYPQRKCAPLYKPIWQIAPVGVKHNHLLQYVSFEGYHLVVCLTSSLLGSSVMIVRPVIIAANFQVHHQTYSDGAYQQCAWHTKFSPLINMKTPITHAVTGVDATYNNSVHELEIFVLGSCCLVHHEWLPLSSLFEDYIDLRGSHPIRTHPADDRTHTSWNSSNIHHVDEGEGTVNLDESGEVMLHTVRSKSR